MKALLLWSLKESGLTFVFFILFMIAALLVIGPFVMIPYIADLFGAWWLLLYVPYFLLLPILGKPLSKFFGE